MVVELERAGIPTAHICTITPVAFMVGSTRIVTGTGIVHPLGNINLSPEDEIVLRRSIIDRAMVALKTEVIDQNLFS